MLAHPLPKGRILVPPPWVVFFGYKYNFVFEASNKSESFPVFFVNFPILWWLTDWLDLRDPRSEWDWRIVHCKEKSVYNHSCLCIFEYFFPSPAPSPDIPDNYFFPWCFIQHAKHICPWNPLMLYFFPGLGQFFWSRRPQHVLDTFQTCLLHFLTIFFCKPMRHNHYQIKDEFIFQRSRVEGTRKILNPRIISWQLIFCFCYGVYWNFA